MKEKYFNIGDIVRIPVSCIEKGIERMQWESPIPSQEIVYSEDQLGQYVKARIIKCNDYVFREDTDYDVDLLDKNGNARFRFHNIQDEDMHICENDQPNHFIRKFQLGDRVTVRAPYFIDHHICVPVLFNRYGTISEIKYEWPGINGINVSYNVKMDNGIDLAINDPDYLIYIPNECHCYDIKKVKFQSYQPYYSDYVNKAKEFLAKEFNIEKEKQIISDSVNKAKEFNIEKEKQMDNTSIYKVIFNDPATIILWNTFHYEDEEYEINGIKSIKRIRVRDKTVVKCSPDEKFNKYNGFCAAVTKRIFETNSAIQRIIREAQDDSKITTDRANEKDRKKYLNELEKYSKEMAKNKKGGSKKNG